MTTQDPDYWYLNRHLLEEGQVFRTRDDMIVKLDVRVPGDGTKWYVGESCGDLKDGFEYWDSTIEPGDLRGDPIPDQLA
jgi:hypothetical protein